MNREWAIPLVLGLLAAAALWAVPDAKQGDEGTGEPTSTSHPMSSTTTSPSGIPDVVLPFAEGKAVDRGNLSFVVLAPHGKAAALRAFDGTASETSAADHLQWQDDHLALYTTSVAACEPNTACDPVWAFGTWLLPRTYGVQPGTRPLLGVDGHNGTRITVHVFDEAGVLVATNAGENQTYLFDDGAHPSQLPGGVWYVGANSTAPNGTQPVPAMARPLLAQLRPMMQGLPVGGVASVRSDAYASVYGTLYVTVRIDGLVQAP